MMDVNKVLLPWTNVMNDLNGEEIIGTFSEKELANQEKEKKHQKRKKKRIEKVIKKQGDKLYFKWKGYDNSFNSWID